ncbi:MAG: hypothetical protein ACLFP4_17250 [Spirochaetales bacterium]
MQKTTLRSRRQVLAALLLLLVAVPASTQLSLDPNDQLYADLELWEARGLTGDLPHLRPYSLQLIRESLAEVLRRGSDSDRRRATFYLEQMEGVELGGGTGQRLGGENYYFWAGPSARLHTDVMENLTLSSALDVYVNNESGNSQVLPAGRYRPIDYHRDAGALTIAGREFAIWQGFRSQLSYGTSDLWIQAGTSRVDYGPFWGNGIVLGAQAQHAPQFSVTWQYGSGSVEILYMELTATNYEGNGRFPNKHYMFHSISHHFLPWLEISVFEAVVFGPRFDLVYFVPFTQLFYQQAFTGFDDNSLVGVSAEARLPADLHGAFSIFIDDLGFNDLAQFDFSTKYKLALQAGLEWVPDLTWLNKSAAEYTLVAPYMYSHVDKQFSEPDSAPNNTNYTHLGENLGPALRPNSDRFVLEASFRPLELTDVGVTVQQIRHGNASEGVTSGDGSLFDDGYTSSGSPTFQTETRFLTQDVIERVLQIGLHGRTMVPLGRGRVNAEVELTPQWTENAALVEGASEFSFFARAALSYHYSW